MYNPTLYDYYHKKRQEGNAHRVALSHVAKKLIGIIFTLETKKIEFDSNQMREPSSNKFKFKTLMSAFYNAQNVVRYLRLTFNS